MRSEDRLHPERPSDHVLMRRFIEGEEEAFVDLVRRHQRPIASYLSRLLGGGSARAEELAQEVFLRVFRHRLGYTEQAEFSTWCYTIATNLARDEIRSRKRRPARTGLEGLEEVAVARESLPSDGLELHELQASVHRALARLPDAVREILVLRDLQGLSYEEIAAVMELELGTVKSRINRARMAFRDVFERGVDRVQEGQL